LLKAYEAALDGNEGNLTISHSEVPKVAITERTIIFPPTCDGNISSSSATKLAG